MRQKRWVGLAAALLMIGCGGESSMDALQAVTRIKELVDATVAEVGVDVELTPTNERAGGPCMDSVGGFTEQMSYGYGFRFTVADGPTGERMVREAARYWKQRGYQVIEYLDDFEIPEIFVDQDDFNYSFTFAREALLVSLGGSTPCVEPLPNGVENPLLDPASG
ncbi:MAG: hypothetical protein ACRD0K_09655 [Egibacteraceae bacterium]